MATTTLLDWILSILRDPAERAAFQSDPDDYADRHGFGDLSPADVHDALWLIADNQSANWDHGSGHVHYPPPPNYHNDDDAGHYLNHYITNDYAVADRRETEVDNSIHQDIDTDGGDFDQTIDNDTVVASADGASAVGEDNEGDISSAGRDNTTAFGDGDAAGVDFSDTDFGSGSAVNIGDGSARGNAEVNTTIDIENSFRTQDNDSVRIDDQDTLVVSDDDVDFDDHSSTQTHTGSHSPVDVDVDDNTVDTL